MIISIQVSPRALFHKSVRAIASADLLLRLIQRTADRCIELLPPGCFIEWVTPFDRKPHVDYGPLTLWAEDSPIPWTGPAPLRHRLKWIGVIGKAQGQSSRACRLFAEQVNRAAAYYNDTIRQYAQDLKDPEKRKKLETKVANDRIWLEK
jgi:hypothetical protein